MNDAGGYHQELNRIRRVADLLCTAHAGLHDRFARRALILDVGVLAVSSWLISLAFVDRDTAVALTPGEMDSRHWMGWLSMGTFLLTLVQLKVDWKGRAVEHRRSFDAYVAIKREAGYVLATHPLDEGAVRRVLASYDVASASGAVIAEADFLSQKRRHKMKVAISKHLDTHPASSLLVTRLKFWWRDNIG